MPWHPTRPSQVFVSPVILIEISEKGDEIESDLPGSKAGMRLSLTCPGVRRG